MIKRNKIDLREEKKIITYLIIDNKFLKTLFPLLKKAYFESQYAQEVLGWILDYYKNYKEAPGNNIQEIFLQKAKNLEEDTKEDISYFLEDLSNWPEIKNHQYTLEQAEQWLKLQSLKLIKKQIELSISTGDTLKGERAISLYNKIERPESSAIDILKDSSCIIDSFMNEEEYLFNFPGKLGDVIGEFIRGDLISFLAFSGKGKSWWLLYVAYLAMINGLNSVFYTLEMPSHQAIRRAWRMVEGRPLETERIEIPFFIYYEKEEKYYVNIMEKEIQGMDLEKVPKKQKQLKLHTRAGTTRIESFPAFSATIDHIKSSLDNMEHYNNYIADVVVIDYADIIKSTVKVDYRHQLDIIWKELRRLALERNILVVTATQSTRDGAKKDVKATNIAEEIRKLNHVAKMISLNQNEKEEELNIQRLELIKERNRKRSTRQVSVGSCFEIGRPYLDSQFSDEVIMD